MVISKITIIFQGFRGGSNIFQGAKIFSGGGGPMLISIETHITWASRDGSFKDLLARAAYFL